MLPREVMGHKTLEDVLNRFLKIFCKMFTSVLTVPSLTNVHVHVLMFDYILILYKTIIFKMTTQLSGLSFIRLGQQYLP